MPTEVPFWEVVTKYSEYEKEGLQKHMEKRLREYGERESIDGGKLIINIRDGLGKKLSKKQATIFIREAIIADPLYIVEPSRFIERFKGVTK